MSIHLLPVVALLGAATFDYPETRREAVVEVHHGTDVPDPYRWLEGDVRVDQEVSDWVDAQNEVSSQYLAAIDARDDIRTRVEELWNYERVSAPVRRGDAYYFSHNDGLQNQSVWYQQRGPDGTPAILLDPNTWSSDGTVALNGMHFSKDGRFLAYARSDGGSDWKTWHIRDLATGADLPETITWSKFSGAAWMPDGSGFYYGRYAPPQDGEALQAANTHQTLWFHRPGTPQSEDVLVHANPDEPNWGWSPVVSEDGRWLVVHCWKGGNKDRILVQDLARNGTSLEPLIDNFDDQWTFVGNVGPRLYFQTSRDAPMGRVVSIDMDQQDKGWTEVIPESRDTMRSVSHVGGKLVATMMRDAASRVVVHGMDGTPHREIGLPGIGSARGFGGFADDPETFYAYTSFTSPPEIFRHDLSTNETTSWRATDVDFDPDQYVVKQVFYESRDGTIVPMFIAHRSDLERTGELPTLLYGYGGFNIPMTPYFSPSRIAWMEMGGVLAVANLRGGGEYGTDWHEAGTKLRKQNVFDDFIAAGEWLVRNGYTRPDRLAIQGGSNGGLLVGACMNQRPDLFGACLPAVGVMDMVRFPEFTIGRAWTPDFGDPAVAEEFEAIYAYSPYHNLDPGTPYPATLVTTADTDDRVVPGHSFKYIAALQHAHGGDAPVMIRVDRKAGHGAGKPTSMRMDEVADVYAFLVENLGMTPMSRPTSGQITQAQ